MSFLFSFADKIYHQPASVTSVADTPMMQVHGVGLVESWMPTGKNSCQGPEGHLESSLTISVMWSALGQ